MSSADLVRLGQEALALVLLTSAPALVASLAVGVLVGLAQAVTQVQEQTLAFVPKFVGVALVLAACGGWMGAQIVRFTASLWAAIPGLVG